VKWELEREWATEAAREEADAKSATEAQTALGGVSLRIDTFMVSWPDRFTRLSL